MIKLITESFDDDHIKNTRKHMSDREAEKYIKKLLRDNSIDLHDYHGNVGGIGWICIETYERGLPDGWQFTDDLTGITAYIDLDGNILRRYDDLKTVYSPEYYRSQGGTRDIPESMMFEATGKKCYVVIELQKDKSPKLIGAFYNKKDAEAVAYEDKTKWRNVIETKIQ